MAEGAPTPNYLSLQSPYRGRTLSITGVYRSHILSTSYKCSRGSASACRSTQKTSYPNYHKNLKYRKLVFCGMRQSKTVMTFVHGSDALRAGGKEKSAKSFPFCVPRLGEGEVAPWEPILMGATPQDSLRAFVFKRPNEWTASVRRCAEVIIHLHFFIEKGSRKAYNKRTRKRSFRGGLERTSMSHAIHPRMRTTRSPVRNL